MSELMDKLKSGRSIKDILGEQAPTRIAPNPARALNIPSMPVRPSIMESDPVELDSTPVEDEVTEQPVVTEIPKDKSTFSTFDVGKIKKLIIELVTKSTNVSYSLIQYLSDETGVPVEQIVKVCLDMLKERLNPATLSSVNTQGNTFDTRKLPESTEPVKPKLALPDMNVLPDINTDPLKESDTPKKSQMMNQQRRPLDIQDDSASISEGIKKHWD
jgi:hypothetical protein